MNAVGRVTAKLTGRAYPGGKLFVPVAVLVAVMVLAAALHLSRGEASALAVTLPLGALAAFVAWGRDRAAPIAPRS